jgi:hypothetical protein
MPVDVLPATMDSPPSSPARTCRKCGVEKPLARPHFYPDASRRDGWSRVCSACLKDASRTARARRKAQPPTPPLLAELAAQLPRTPSKPSFRAQLEEAAGKRFPKLAEKTVELALAGDRQMLRLVMAYMLGTPREAADDDGPGEYFRAIFAAAQTVAPASMPARLDAAADPDDA